MAFFVILFIVIVLLAWWTSHKSTKFKEEVVRKALKENFDVIEFEHKAGFPQKEIFETKLIASGNRYHSNDRVTLNYRDHVVVMSDVSVMDEQKNGDSTTTTTLFDGQVFKIKLKKTWQDRIYVIDRHNSHAMSGFDQFFRKEKYERFETESIGFNKEYRLYGSDHEAALKLLTPEFIHDLELIHKENMSFMVDEDTVYITVYSRKNLFEPKYIKSESQEESERRVVSEFKQALKCVDLFLDRS